jgi:hypothetical protein
MSTERKHHFEWNEIKIRIIDFILRAECPVSEPDVRDFLKKDYGEFSRSTTNKHLKAINDLDCIEQVKPENKSKFKFYDIEFKNLKNIKEKFSDIQLSDYTKAKNMIIIKKFPCIGPRYEKKYFIYMSLFPSLFYTFLTYDFELMVDKAFELWKIEDYEKEISTLTDTVYKRSFMHENWFDPSNSFPLIEEVSKDVLEIALKEIQYPNDEKDHDKKENIINEKLLEKLVNVVLSKRSNSTKAQVQKEIYEKIIEPIYYKIPDKLYPIVLYNFIRREKICDKICKNFYENDFICGRVEEGAETFVNKLEECIKNVNDAYNITPSSEEPHPGKKFQATVDELDALYDEWYGKCLQKDNERLT